MPVRVVPKNATNSEDVFTPFLDEGRFESPAASELNPIVLPDGKLSGLAPSLKFTPEDSPAKPKILLLIPAFPLAKKLVLP